MFHTLQLFLLLLLLRLGQPSDSPSPSDSASSRVSHSQVVSLSSSPSPTLVESLSRYSSESISASSSVTHGTTSAAPSGAATAAESPSGKASASGSGATTIAATHRSTQSASTSYIESGSPSASSAAVLTFSPSASVFVCPIGFFCASPYVAAPCPPGTYGDAYSLTTPLCSGPCEVGHFCTAGSTNATARLCPVGSFCEAGSGAPTPCPSGTFGAFPGLKTPACSGACSAGYYCPRGSTSSFSRRCEAGSYCLPGSAEPSMCPSGTFGNTSLLKTPACSGICPRGFYCPVGEARAPLACPFGSSGVSRAGLQTLMDCVSPTSAASASTAPLRSQFLSTSALASASAVESASATASETPTPSQTPTSSSGKQSCASRAEGCSLPVVFVGAPEFIGSPVTDDPGSAKIAVAAWPLFRSSLEIRFPVPPEVGEALTIACSSDSARINISARDDAVALPPDQCPGQKAGAACVVMSFALNRVSMPVARFWVFANGPGPAIDGSARVVCALRQIKTPPPPLLPRYAPSLDFEQAARSLPLSLPLLATILEEQENGRFLGVAGAATGKVFIAESDSISLVAESDLEDAGNCADLLSPSDPLDAYSLPLVDWASQSTTLCSAASSAMRTLAAASAASASPPSLGLSVTKRMHLLLVAHAASPLPVQLRVALGGVACTVNWVLSDGSMASITTPTLAELCTALAAANKDDCGAAPLVLSGDSALKDFVLAASTGQALANNAVAIVTVSYPPVLARGDWGAFMASPVPGDAGRGSALDAASPLGSLVFAANGDTSAPLSLSALRAPPGDAPRVFAPCVGPSFAPPAICSIASRMPDAKGLVPDRKVCGWGAAYACLPCPLGATCPGGYQLLPRAGWWLPHVAAAPSDLRPCRAPRAEERCPFGVPGKCGAGFAAGRACSACAPGHWLGPSGDCAACPAHGEGPAVAILFGSLALCLFALTSIASAARASSPFREALSFLLWFLRCLQPLAAAMASLTTVSGPYAAVVASLAALQLRGIVHGECVVGAPEFLRGWLAVGAGLFLALSTALSVSLRRTLLFRASLMLWAALIGAIVAELASVGSCEDTRPITVAEYLSLRVQDGSSLSRALADSSSDLFSATRLSGAGPAGIAAAFGDAALAARAGLEQALVAHVSVSTVSGDAGVACMEGLHFRLRVSVFVTLGLCCLVPVVILMSAAMAAMRGSLNDDFSLPSASKRLWPFIQDALRTDDSREAPPAAIVRAFEFVVAIVTSGLASRSVMTEDDEVFLWLVSGAALLTAAAAIVAIKVRASEEHARWRDGSRASILMFSAAANCLATAKSGAAGLCALIASICLIIAITRAWALALARRAAVNVIIDEIDAKRARLSTGKGGSGCEEEGGGGDAKKVAPLEDAQASAGDGEHGSIAFIENPLQLARQAFPPRPKSLADPDPGAADMAAQRAALQKRLRAALAGAVVDADVDIGASPRAGRWDLEQLEKAVEAGRSALVNTATGLGPGASSSLN
jgi:hypothetical protein